MHPSFGHSTPSITRPRQHRLCSGRESKLLLATTKAATRAMPPDLYQSTDRCMWHRNWINFVMPCWLVHSIIMIVYCLDPNMIVYCLDPNIPVHQYHTCISILPDPHGVRPADRFAHPKYLRGENAKQKARMRIPVLIPANYPSTHHYRPLQLAECNACPERPITNMSMPARNTVLDDAQNQSDTA